MRTRSIVNYLSAVGIADCDLKKILSQMAMSLVRSFRLVIESCFPKHIG